MLGKCSPGFRRLLEPFSFEEIERDEGTVYGMRPDFRLAYFNPAWVRFARANGGDPAIVSESYLGTSLLDVTPEVLRPFYRLKYLSCLHQTGKQSRPIQHRYECSSAELYRDFVMTLYPLREAQGLLVVNSKVVERPHRLAERSPEPPVEESYADGNGIIHQCTHCRRVRHLQKRERWDWVPAWVEGFPPEVSHTLCPFCLRHFYLESGEDPAAVGIDENLLC